MTFNFLLHGFLTKLAPENVKTRSGIRQTTQEAENRYSLKNKACQAPHSCYKSASAYMSCVDNIPTVFAAAPLPLFSLLQLLVGLQLKHRPLFTGSLHISITITSPFWKSTGLISLSLSFSHPRGQSMVIQ